MQNETDGLGEYNLKQRIITAVIGMIVFAIVLFCYETVFFDVAIGVVSILAVYEFLLATKCTKSKPISVMALFLTALPFLNPKWFGDGLSLTLFYYIYAAIMILLLIISAIISFSKSSKVTIGKVLLAFTAAVVMPYLFYILIFIRNQYGLYEGLYYTLLIFSCSWGADSGAYFIGKFFGKHKLAPKISPNKTIEGVYGGVASSVLFVAVITLIYYLVMQAVAQPVEINYLMLLFIAIVGSLVGVVGDLSASMIKRQCQVKDFGTIMPGHGGVLDRFDSVLLVAPFIYAVLFFM